MTNPAPADPDPPDQVLVQRARGGDLDAYDVLVRRHHSRLYGMVFNMTRSRQDAEDLLQEVFVKAYDALKGFKGDAAFYTWIYRIAVNRAINFVKNRKRRMTVSLNDPGLSGESQEDRRPELSNNDTPARDARLKEIQEKLNRALDTLSDNHKTVVIMHDMQGIPHEQIAEVLGISCGTVRSRLFYARQALQVQLTEFKDEL
ncbi:MAG: sigma-70 family RNA polymerase sigma factor [Kiritimatiellia bacterium]